MTIIDPGEVHNAWAQCFNSRDLHGMLDLAEDGAVFVPQPGVGVRGDDATAAQQQFLALGLPIQMTVRHVYVNDDIALVVGDWTISGTGPDGTPVNLAGGLADVLRRGADGGWRFAIDNPFGTA